MSGSNFARLPMVVREYLIAQLSYALLFLESSNLYDESMYGKEERPVAVHTTGSAGNLNRT